MLPQGPRPHHGRLDRPAQFLVGLPLYEQGDEVTNRCVQVLQPGLLYQHRTRRGSTSGVGTLQLSLQQSDPRHPGPRIDHEPCLPGICPRVAFT